PWVSAILHIAFPALVLLDWLAFAPSAPPRWRELWAILPYPLLWLAVVLMRGATDGWVPYGFLLPERGPASLLAHIAGLLAALLVAGALVWAAARVAVPRHRSDPQHRPAASR
ncbi:MAG: Pr6Pr family membrane protein, partial [Actinobacteria bacterium]|nr:Pr6Pr family membrane protein [Actinomycetota bacterium]